MDVKDKIKRLRKIKGWTTTALAQKAGIGQSTLSQIEKGRNKPSVEVLGKIAKVLEVSTDYLLDRERRIISEPKIRDIGLLKQFRQIDQLEDKEREAVKTFLEVFLSNRSTKKSRK